jgi:hypothetical protein
MFFKASDAGGSLYFIREIRAIRGFLPSAGR